MRRALAVALAGVFLAATPVRAQTIPAGFLSPVQVFPASAVNGAGDIFVPDLATTSTDGLVLINPTAATSGVPVQLSPRLGLCGTAWNTTATETSCFYQENLPVTAATPTGIMRILYSRDGAGASNPYTLTSAGSGTYLGAVTLGTASGLHWPSKTWLLSSADGNMTVSNNALTIGSILKADALPTAGTCGTSPAVTAGSTPFAGSINVGTATPASCILVFGGTAFPSAPFCTANVVTSTAGSTRAIGTLSTVSQVTFTPATAFADSSVVAYTCISSK